MSAAVVVAVFVWTLGDVVGGALLLLAGLGCLAMVIESEVRDRRARRERERARREWEGKR